MSVEVPRRLAAEFIGTALLLTIVVGSGIMGERLANGNTAIALLANSLATGGGLFVLIMVFAPVSGAHFNPLVTACAVFDSAMSLQLAAAYLAVQLGGALAGVALAHSTFDMPLLIASAKVRTGFGQWLAEGIATFGLVLTIRGALQHGIPVLAAAVAAYIASAYWFTASTSFANPVVTIARAFTPTFTGIRPDDIVGFVAAQCVGAAAGLICGRWLVNHASSKPS